jgi:hypothetical protein
MGGIPVIKRYAIVVDGRVVNVAVAESAIAPNWIESDTASIGDYYYDGGFHKLPKTEE